MVKFFHMILKNKKKHISFGKDLSPGNLQETKSTEMLAEESGVENRIWTKVLFSVLGLESQRPFLKVRGKLCKA